MSLENFKGIIDQLEIANGSLKRIEGYLEPDTDTFDKNECHDMDGTINRLKTAFFHQLEYKTGWGRNEVKDIFNNAVFSIMDD